MAEDNGAKGKGGTISDIIEEKVERAIDHRMTPPVAFPSPRPSEQERPKESGGGWTKALFVTLALAAATAIATAAVAKFQAGEAYGATKELVPAVAHLEEQRKADREFMQRMETTLKENQAVMTRAVEHMARQDKPSPP